MKHIKKNWKQFCIVEDLKVNINTYKNWHKKPSAFFFSAQNLIFVIWQLEHKYQYDTIGFYPNAEILKSL